MLKSFETDYGGPQCAVPYSVKRLFEVHEDMVGLTDHVGADEVLPRRYRFVNVITIVSFFPK